MAEDCLVIERRDNGVALLILNRPDRLNAVTMALQEKLDSALQMLAEDDGVRCLAITGAGDRAFSAGYDVHEMADWSADDLRAGLARREAWIERLVTTPLPLVVALNGITYGFGAILATAADVRIGCPQTRLRFTAVPHGGANATWSLPSLVGRGQASEILMTARPVDADEALRIGLLNRVVDTTDLLDAALQTAAAIAAHPAAGVQAVKRLLRERDGMLQALAAENELMRTELAPKPIGELFSEFLGERQE